MFLSTSGISGTAAILKIIHQNGKLLIFATVLLALQLLSEIRATGIRCDDTLYNADMTFV